MEKEQLKTIMTPEFMQELMDLETAEDVQKAMEQKGISLSIPEINKLQSADAGKPVHHYIHEKGESHMQEKLNALLEDEAFLNKMLNAENPEQVSALFAENGITMSAKEVEILRSRLENADGGELSEDQLENVAGGVDLDLIDDVLNSIVKVGERLFDSISRRRW